MKKISNERLRDWINAYDEIGDNDLALVLRELLDLRERYDRANLDIAHKICELGVEKEYTGRLEEQNRLLVEDSERMESCIRAMDEAHQKEGKPRSLLAKGVLNLHTALMKQVKD